MRRTPLADGSQAVSSMGQTRNMESKALSLLFGIGVCLSAFALGGCRDAPPPGSPMNPNYRPPPSNASQAAALSGGKITRFVPAADTNPADPSDRVKLKACRQLPVTSHTAHGAYYVVSCRMGTISLPVMVVGEQTLVSPNQLVRGMVLAVGGYVRKGHNVKIANAKNGDMIIYPDWQRFPNNYIMLTPGSQYAVVDWKPVRLQHPVVWVEPEKVQVMLLSDWLRVFKASDAQTGVRSLQPIGLSSVDVLQRR